MGEGKMSRFLGPQDNEIILFRDHDALVFGCNRRPELSREQVWQMLCKGESDGDIETRCTVGPKPPPIPMQVENLPPIRPYRLWDIRSVERYFSRLPGLPRTVHSERKQPGPESGSVGFAKQDEALFDEMDRLVTQDHRSSEDAATELDRQGRVQGLASATRIRRLAKHYRESGRYKTALDAR
jgi:hypothetical protein